jgi:hypothetical protein
VINYQNCGRFEGQISCCSGQSTEVKSLSDFSKSAKGLQKLTLSIKSQSINSSRLSLKEARLKVLWTRLAFGCLGGIR